MNTELTPFHKGKRYLCYRYGMEKGIMVVTPRVNKVFRHVETLFVQGRKRLGTKLLASRVWLPSANQYQAFLVQVSTMDE